MKAAQTGAGWKAHGVQAKRTLDNLEGSIQCVGVDLRSSAVYQGLVKLLELTVKASWLFTCLIGFLILPVMLVILTEGCISINLILKTSLIFWPEQVLPGVC